MLNILRTAKQHAEIVANSVRSRHYLFERHRLIELNGYRNRVLQAHAVRPTQAMAWVVPSGNLPQNCIRREDLALSCEVENLRLRTRRDLPPKTVRMSDLVNVGTRINDTSKRIEV